MRFSPAKQIHFLAMQQYFAYKTNTGVHLLKAGVSFLGGFLVWFFFLQSQV